MFKQCAFVFAAITSFYGISMASADDCPKFEGNYTCNDSEVDAIRIKQSGAAITITTYGDGDELGSMTFTADGASHQTTIDGGDDGSFTLTELSTCSGNAMHSQMSVEGEPAATVAITLDGNQLTFESTSDGEDPVRISCVKQ
jgi:hypothetical protein